MSNKKIVGFTDTVARVSAASGVKRSEVQNVLICFYNLIEGTLVDGGVFRFRGLGKFEVVDRAARTRRNPQTGGVVDVPAGVRVKFVRGSMIKDIEHGKVPGPDGETKDPVDAAMAEK